MIKTIEKQPLGEVIAHTIQVYGLIPVIKALIKRMVMGQKTALPTTHLNDHLRRDIGLAPKGPEIASRIQTPPRIY